MVDSFLKKQKGVTLTELLIVVSIIAILAGIAIFFFRGQIFKGNDAKRKGDLRKIQVAIEEYEKDKDCYPLPQIVSCNPGEGLKPYLSKIPCDPDSRASYIYEHDDSTCPSWYRMYAKLTNDSDSDISELGCAAGCGPNLAYNYYVASPNAPLPDQGGGAPPPGGGGSASSPPAPPTTQFYGCSGGACTQISWDPARPGPECDPNYLSPTCYNQCGMPDTECEAWK